MNKKERKEWEEKENTIDRIGKDAYFKVKQEHEPCHDGFVYVSFRDEYGRVENMWVRIMSGNREKGFGFLDNEPVKLEDCKFGDLVAYETGEDGKTRPIG